MDSAKECHEVRVRRTLLRDNTEDSQKSNEATRVVDHLQRLACFLLSKMEIVRDKVCDFKVKAFRQQ